MARRKPLISHVEVDIEFKIKSAADAANETASSYIAKILTEHVEGQSVHSIAMYARDAAACIAAQDIKVDDMVVVDPVIGMERVVRSPNTIDTKGSGKVVHLQLERHLPRTGKRISRFAFRGWAEPVIVVKV